MKKICLTRLSHPILGTADRDWNLLLWSLTLFLFLTLSCKKSNLSKPSLPPITQEGKNTFGCKISNQVWVPYFPCNDIYFGGMEMSYNTTPVDIAHALPIRFGLGVGNVEGGGTFIDFGPKVSNFVLKDTGNIIDSLSIDLIGHPSGTIYYNYIGRGFPHYVQITKLDTANKIVSGIFSFTLYSGPDLNHSDSITITEGRFDIQIRQYFRCSN
jgi:hypothetical protein